MTSSEERDTGGAGGGGGLLGALKNSPAISSLGDAAKDYARARGSDAAKKIGGKLTGVTGSLTDKAEGGGFKSAAVSKAVEKVAQGESPVKAAVSGVGAGIKEKVKSAFGKSGGAGGNKKFINIIEDITIGVPVDVAYDQWTQYQEYGKFMKGVDSVDQADEVTTNWKVKVAKSRRSWKATVTEQIPDRRIVWTSEGAKGDTKGVVTFHPLADDLTQVLLVMEYYPKGLFEKTGNIWRAQGRRARLDLKHFRRFVMFRNEATGSWRGEIRDGEVVRGPDEEESDQQAPEDQAGEDAEDTGAADAGDESEDDDYDQDRDEDEEDEDDDGYEDDDAEDETADDEATADEAPEDEAPEDEPDEEPVRPARRRRREPVGAR